MVVFHRNYNVLWVSIRSCRDWKLFKMMGNVAQCCGHHSLEYIHLKTYVESQADFVHGVRCWMKRLRLSEGFLHAPQTNKLCLVRLVLERFELLVLMKYVEQAESGLVRWLDTTRISLVLLSQGEWWSPTVGWWTVQWWLPVKTHTQTLTHTVQQTQEHKRMFT